MTNNNTMENGNKGLFAAVNEMMGRFGQARRHVSENVNDSWEDYTRRCDESANIVKAAFFGAWEEIARITGILGIKKDILRIYEKGCNEETGKKEILKMAKEVRECMDSHIEFLKMCGSTEKADILKEIVHNGSIFSMFAGTICWIGGKIYRKARKLFQIDNKKSIIGALFRSISGLANVLWSGAKIVIETGKFVVSIIAAGALVVADFILGAVKWLFDKLKSLGRKVIGKPADDIDVLEDEFDEVVEDAGLEDEDCPGGDCKDCKYCKELSTNQCNCELYGTFDM